MLRLLSKVLHLPEETPLSIVWPNILLKVLQPSGAWHDNSLRWRSQSVQLLLQDSAHIPEVLKL